MRVYRLCVVGGAFIPFARGRYGEGGWVSTEAAAAAATVVVWAG